MPQSLNLSNTMLDQKDKDRSEQRTSRELLHVLTVCVLCHGRSERWGGLKSERNADLSPQQSAAGVAPWTLKLLVPLRLRKKLCAHSGDNWPLHVIKTDSLIAICCHASLRLRRIPFLLKEPRETVNNVS